MPASSNSEIAVAVTGGAFPPTRWSLIRKIQGAARDSEDAQLALDEICRLYWIPVYVFFRRNGKGQEDAEDLTQGFFQQLLTGPFFDRSDPERGRLRSYLLGSAGNFLAVDRRRQSALKRGGKIRFLHIDAEHAEGIAFKELVASEQAGPDELFERRWALDLLERALLRLRTHYVKLKQDEVYEVVSPMISEAPKGAVATAASKLSQSHNAVRIALYRMKKRFQEAVRAEVELTLEPGGNIEEELAHLAGLLG
ncbi:MAG: DNA-directed RNA polymerase specialized sigma24 family protein [Verrucomicrobiales bacterium]|jgi:DNA-directed RNA polymerase specialized sigma24 family protein